MQKNTGEIEYNLKALLLEYHWNSSNMFCFTSLASEFTASGENISARDIEMRVE